MEEAIAADISDEWDEVETNVVYSHPVPSDTFPKGFIRSDGSNPVGEKDIFLYSESQGSSDTVGYIERKTTSSRKQERRAENQVGRAQKHWNELGYDFVGGFVTTGNIRPWNGKDFDHEVLRADQFELDRLNVSPADNFGDFETEKGDLALRLEKMGWDEAFEDVLYGKALETDLKGIAGTSSQNSHFGQMDAVAYRNHEDGEIIGHVERYNNPLKDVEGRLDFSHDFWTDQGYDFQGGLYTHGEIFRRDFDEQEWIDTPPS